MFLIGDIVTVIDENHIDDTIIGDKSKVPVLFGDKEPGCSVGRVQAVDKPFDLGFFEMYSKGLALLIVIQYNIHSFKMGPIISDSLWNFMGLGL